MLVFLQSFYITCFYCRASQRSGVLQTETMLHGGPSFSSLLTGTIMKECFPWLRTPNVIKKKKKTTFISH